VKGHRWVNLDDGDEHAGRSAGAADGLTE